MPAIALETLLGCPIFSSLGHEEAAKLAPLFQRRDLRTGQTVFSAGDAGDALYVVERGRVRVVATAPQGQEITLANLGAGKHFGEMALFTGERRSATIRAAEETVLWRLDKADFEALVGRQPRLSEYFQTFVQNVALRTFLRRQTVFGRLGAADLRQLVERLELSAFRVGEYVFREGDASRDFFIVRSGTFAVIRSEGGVERTVATLSTGDSFGETGVMAGTRRTAAVRALEAAEVYVLPGADFHRILGASPQVRDQLSRRMQEFREAAIRDAPSLPETPAPAAPAPSPPPRARGPLPRPGSAGHWRSVSTFLGPTHVEQAEELDCAAACLTTVSHWYGARSAMPRVKAMTNVTKDGATILSLAQAAEDLGFDTWIETVTPQRLAGVELPAIALWQGYHWVVVFEVGPARAVVVDPEIGTRHVTPDELARGLTGPALVLVPRGRIRRLSGTGIGLPYFLPLFRPYLGLIWEIFLCSLLLTVFGLSVPIFTSTVVDSVMVRGSTGMLTLMLVGMLVIAAFQLVAQALQQYLALYASTRIDLGLVIRFYRHVLRLPASFYDSRKVGDILARFEENEEVRKLFTGTPLSVVLSLFTVVLYLTLMSLFNLELTLALLAYIPLFALVTWTATPIMRRLANEAFARTTQASAFLIESITGIQTVKALAIEQPVRWRWHNTFIDGASRELRRELAEGALESTSGFLQSLSTVTLLYFGAHQVMQGRLTTGQLMAFYSMIGMVMNPLVQLLSIWADLQRGLLGLERIAEVLALEQEQPEAVRQASRPIPRIRGHVVFDEVTFSYDPRGGRRHLDRLSFEALPGQTIAIVGRSGAGKTTLAALLLKLREPIGGRILIDGHDLARTEIESLRRQVGVVMQDNFLFSGTIRENICTDNPDTPLDDIVRAATLAGANDFISALPMGYDTVIGERGASLSGGQRQRVAIARCLFRDPRILIFDEATSSLDTESEHIIQANMARFLRGRTSFVIAHRLSTVRSADRILVMDAGRIVESGSHHELMAQRGLYYYLNRQTIRED